jgi:ethanolamine-phosphate cytidylyltransferase
MLQSRRFGDELLVGLHNDEDIAANKGPTVMNLAERVAAVNACRFSTLCVPHAPYVTSIPWISHYGCKYVTHGDDITSDANGNDCYRFVKKVGRMKIVPRTPGISTTDLVGRMLAGSKDHFIASLIDCIEGRESGTEGDRQETGEQMQKRFREYAAAPNGLDPYVEVFTLESAGDDSTKAGHLAQFVSGVKPRPGQRIVYVDGGFDLFSSGHIAFLQTVAKLESELGREQGWYSEAAKQQRISSTGSDYGPAYVIAGVHDDRTINHHLGKNFPIMNIFERGLCVVQCEYIDSVVFNAPVAPSKAFLDLLATQFGSSPSVYWHGPTAFMSITGSDPHADVKALGIFRETPAHEFQDVNAAQIVLRILNKRAEYEERQRKKGVKKVGEEEQHRLEKLQHSG